MPDDQKEQIYNRIVNRPPQVVLERMRVHGFWPSGEGLPPDPPAESQERTQIAAELAQLSKTAGQVKNPEKALAEERKRRRAASEQKRAAAKANRAKLSAERRAAWLARRQAGLVHAGLGVSAGLAYHDAASVGDTQADRLAQQSLPLVRTPAELAELLGVKLSVLRWLTYHRRAAAVVHYHRFEIAKKTGGVRCISAPKTALANAQRAVLDKLLSRLATEPPAHGFVSGRSILTNAAPHAGRAVVANLDLRNFFPTITFRRVKGLFRQMGYSEAVATVLGLLCTEPPRVPTEYAGKVWHVALGSRVLPQGACTSPAITNLICRVLDRRLAGLASKYQFTYTRYADDLTFSGDDPKVLCLLIASVRRILTDEGFTEHPAKTRIMRAGNRQEVTGLTVNEKPAVARQEIRELRAILHNAARDGLASQNRSGRPDWLAHLRGRVEFVAMVDPEKGAELRAALDQALAVRPSPYRACLEAVLAALATLSGEQLTAAQALAPVPAAGEPPHSWVVSLATPDQPTTAVALLRAGTPVLGAVAQRELPDDAGTVIGWAEGCGPVRLNGQPIRRRPSPSRSGLAAAMPEVVLVPSEATSAGQAELARQLAPRRFIVADGLGYRLALLAAGRADAAVGLAPMAPTSATASSRFAELAAGAALLCGAGLTLLNRLSEPLTFAAAGAPEPAFADRVFAGSAAVAGELARLAWEPSLLPQLAAGLKPQPELAPVSRVFAAPLPAGRPKPRRVSDPRVLSRAHGCLLGQFAGDALGGLVEFQSPSTIRARYPLGVRDLADGGHWRNLAGQPTDDSEMALMLARTLVREGRYDAAAVLTGYVHWLRSPPFDIGGTTSTALRAAAQSLPLGSAAALEAVARNASTSSQANGSLMRISPVGIFAAGRPTLASELARLDSGLTHPNAVCRDASAVFAAAVAQAIGGAVTGGSAGADLTPQEVYAFAVGEAARINADPSVRECLELARERPPADFVANMGWVRIAFQNAFWQLLHAPSAEAGIIDTVGRGGDTDTNGAIAGALLGAVHGRDAIPVRWQTAILCCRPIRLLGVAHPRPPEFWPVDVLELAEALLLAGSDAGRL